MSNEFESVQTVPTLTLEPFAETNQVMADTKNELVKEAEPALDDSILTEEEKQAVAAFAEQIDLTNSSMILQYGAGTQKKMADFSENALENVKTKDLGEVGNLLSGVVKELKNFDEEEEKGFLGIFKKTSNKIQNMTPSLNIAFNKDLEKDRKKLDLAFDVLDCMISQEGQRLIADGSGVISLNVDVPNMMEDVPGLEDEINNNSVYIRYSAQKSFNASLKAVHGLLSGEMDETQAYDVFRSTMNSKDSKEETTVNFENEYSISLNDKNGRDAASSILTTIREEKDAQLALVPYYYFTSSIYKGECTDSRVGLMTAKNSDTPLYLAKINGKEIYELAEKYLSESDEKFHVTNKYELPIASGMKIIVRQEENGFSLKDIEVNKEKIDKEKEYSILLTNTTMSILKKINPGCEIRQIRDTTLSSAWTTAMAKGQQPSAPEDYIEVEK